MSIEAMVAVFNHSVAKGNVRLVELAIADNANADGYAWPGAGEIARKAGVCEKTVQRCIAKAQELGELEVVARSGTSNMYRILVSAPSENQEDKVSRVDSSVQGVGTAVSTPPRTAVSDEPSIEPSIEPSSSASVTQGEVAQRITSEFWESTFPKPSASFLAIRMRVQEALDGGHEPDAISQALPTMQAFTRNSFDFALRKGRPAHSSRGSTTPAHDPDCSSCGGTGWIPDPCDPNDRTSLPCMADLTSQKELVL